MNCSFHHALLQFGLACLPALVLSAGGSHAATPDSQAGGMPDAFLRQHCLRCHDAKTQEGQLRIDTLSRDFASLSAAAKWAEVMTRINAGEMPPEEEPRPTADEIAAVVGWISGRIEAGEAARMAARGPVASYRLSREEYAHTIDDLLGIRVDPTVAGGLLEDSRWHGFERIGAMLTLAPAHVERYLKMADDVLELAFPEKEPTPSKRRIDAYHIIKSHIKNEVPAERLAKIGLTPDQLRIPLWPGAAGAPLWQDWWWGHRQPGVWRGRLQLSGMPGLDGRALGTARLAAIGPATRDALERAGFACDLVPTQFRSEGITAALVQEPSPARFLLVRANRGRDLMRRELEARGHVVQEVTAYASEPVDPLDAATAAAIDGERVDWITITSSLIAESAVRLFGPRLRQWDGDGPGARAKAGRRCNLRRSDPRQAVNYTL